MKKSKPIMEEARKHPTGRYWVDNFLKPTVLTHQFIRAERERATGSSSSYVYGRMMPYLFSAGQFHYPRYISWHLLDMRYLLPPKAKANLLAGAHVCRHSEGCWNSVSGDQFVEQTAIKTGKGGLKGITLSPELVTEWIDSFPISVYVSYDMGHMYSQADQLPNSSSQTKHKEEGNTRRKLEFDDRETLSSELAKHFHPLAVQSEVLYNIVNGQVVPADINVDDAADI